MNSQIIQIDYPVALKKRRQKNGKTQIVVAQEIGIGLDLLRKVEQGYTTFNINTKNKLDKWLGVKK